MTKTRPQLRGKKPAVSRRGVECGTGAGCGVSGAARSDRRRGRVCSPDPALVAVLPAPLVPGLHATTPAGSHLVDVAANGLPEPTAEGRAAPAVVEAQVEFPRLVAHDVARDHVLPLEERGVGVYLDPGPDLLAAVLVRQHAASAAAEAIEALGLEFRGPTGRVGGSSRGHGIGLEASLAAYRPGSYRPSEAASLIAGRARRKASSAKRRPRSA